MYKLIISLLAITLTGCTQTLLKFQSSWPSALEKVEKSTVIKSAVTQKGEDSNLQSIAEQSSTNWWQHWRDAQLSALVEQALNSNRELKRSALRIQLAASTAQQLANYPWPVPQANTGATAQRPVFPHANPFARGGLTQLAQFYSVGWSLEIDWWGKRATEAKIGKLSIDIAEKELETSTLLISTQVANLYWTLATIDAQHKAIDALIAEAKEEQRIVRLLIDEGMVASIELLPVSQVINNQLNRKKLLGYKRKETLVALALLMNENPSTYTGPIEVNLPDILHYASLPPFEQTKAHRADVQSALLKYQQNILRERNAKLNWLPELSASYALGSGGLSLTEFVFNASHFGGLNIQIPFLNWTRLALERKSARLTTLESELATQEAEQTAIAEIERSFLGYQGSDLELEAQVNKQNNALQELSVAQLRAEEGIDPPRAMISRRVALRELEINALDLQLQHAQNVLDLQKNLVVPLVFWESDKSSSSKP